MFYLYTQYRLTSVVFEYNTLMVQIKFTVNKVDVLHWGTIWVGGVSKKIIILFKNPIKTQTQIMLTFCKRVRFGGGGGTPKSVNFICTIKV